MALIQCPECGKEFSDTANSCCHCGYAYKKILYEKKISDLKTKAKKDFKEKAINIYNVLELNGYKISFIVITIISFLLVAHFKENIKQFYVKESTKNYLWGQREKLALEQVPQKWGNPRDRYESYPYDVYVYWLRTSGEAWQTDYGVWITLYFNKSDGKLFMFGVESGNGIRKPFG